MVVVVTDMRIVWRIGVSVLCLIAILGVLKGIQEYGDSLEMIEQTGPEVVEGDLTRSPILFTQNDFYIYPSRVEAEGGTLRVPALASSGLLIASSSSS